MAAPATPPRRPAKRITQQPARPRDPAIERALQLSTFEGNYGTEEFISVLSDKLIDSSKTTPGPFNPAPFLQTFSPALDSLLALRAQVAERTKKMETDVRRAEREYGKRLRELDGGFETIGKSFTNLESKITDVGRTAIRIGEQLESLHQTRSTAQSTSLLLSYYLSSTHASATDDQTSPLEQLFATRASRGGREKLAVVLRRLMIVAKDRRREKERGERVRDQIESYCERFEKELLRLFDRSYRKGDPRMMAHCAKTLQEFNGGASCIQIYVNQHDFFIKDHHLDESSSPDTVDLWAEIANPDSPAPTSEPALEKLCTSIRETIAQESQIMKAVFHPNSSAVMEGFLQRIFAQIQQHLENLVSRAASTSTLALLRILHLTHTICAALVDDLKVYDGVLTSPLGPRSSLDAGSSSSSVGGEWSGKGAGAGAGTGTLSAYLDRVLEEMYVPWLEGSRYLESESKNLVELYAGLLSRFTRYHETVLEAKPNSLLNKVVHQLASSSSAASSATSSSAQTAAQAIGRYANLFTSTKDNPSGTSTPIVNAQAAAIAAGGTAGARTDAVSKGLEDRDRVWSTDGVVTVGMAERMLRWHAEAVGRCVELSGGDVGKNALALLKVLSEAIGRSFVETSLDSTLVLLSSQTQDHKTPPDLSPLQTLKATAGIHVLWQKYSGMAVVPLAGGNAGLRREMVGLGRHGVVRLEGKVNEVVQKGVDLILGHLAHILTKQKKNDYKPKDDDISFARTITEPCELAVAFLGEVRDAVRGCLTGRNAEGFLVEVGVGFHALLLDHYKKFPVNPTGGLMLTKDLASYQDIIATFSIPALNERFDMLRQLGNSFIVQPNVLKTYLTEGHLGKIERELLRPYLMQRSDWSTFSRGLELDEAGVLGGEDLISVPAGNGNGNGGGNGGGGGRITGMLGGAGSRLSMVGVGGGAGSRLSTMSGVAGAGMGRLKEMMREFEAGDESSRKAGIGGQGGGVGYQPTPLFYMGMH
ncbi:exocyst complex component protein [Cryptococcus wingfieldii CBS 7118]|uniref:Exocyst complex component protein n=1 Tax=Cryptococcus wingfieldii CBS 7118 TaxID=1295528 RepID=A0A1E3ICZ9_9TREE|nr:exocyst complex component protein [Cryptococcus wingfieldii CBS 7118]ODN86325.1 exocyst complex component protein [Cryptococcus wingfieldii CBS 7118]